MLVGLHLGFTPGALFIKDVLRFILELSLKIISNSVLMFDS